MIVSATQKSYNENSLISIERRRLHVKRELWKRECQSSLTAWCIEALRPVSQTPARHHQFISGACLLPSLPRSTGAGASLAVAAGAGRQPRRRRTTGPISRPSASRAASPRIRYRRPVDRRTRPQRWHDAVAELLALQAEYAAWRLLERRARAARRQACFDRGRQGSGMTR